MWFGISEMEFMRKYNTITGIVIFMMMENLNLLTIIIKIVVFYQKNIIKFIKVTMI